MPTRHGQTGWIHKDHQTQREFERLSRDISTIKKDAAAGQPTSPASSPSTTSDWALSVKHNGAIVPTAKWIQGLNFIDIPLREEKDEVVFDIVPSSLENALMANGTTNPRQVNIKGYSRRRILKGIIPINKLPDNSVSYEEIDAWKREGLFFTPEYGYYGWYVYNYIDHGWLLKNPNDYILTLVDTHQVIEEDIYLPDVEYKQQFIPEHEGLRIQYRDANNNLLEKDIIVIRAVYKPLADVFMGVGITYDAVEINELERLINTNLVFHYTLEVRK